MTLYVFAKIIPKKEHFDDVRQAILDIMPETLSEEGCLQFDLLAADAEPANLFLQEAWADGTAFEYHHKQEHTKAVFAKYQQWLAQPVEILHMHKLSA